MRHAIWAPLVRKKKMNRKLQSTRNKAWSWRSLLLCVGLEENSATEQHKRPPEGPYHKWALYCI